jgi:hypothetical protein
VSEAGLGARQLGEHSLGLVARLARFCPELGGDAGGFVARVDGKLWVDRRQGEQPPAGGEQTLRLGERVESSRRSVDPHHDPLEHLVARLWRVAPADIRVGTD